ncbi:MAG: hypothetical protein WCP21_06195 [Armatimonadota bacterium]
MPYPPFDRSHLLLRPLAERVHDMVLSDVMPVDGEVPLYDNPDLDRVAEAVLAARTNGKATKIFLPLEASGVMGAIAAMGDAFKEGQTSLPLEPDPPAS